MSLLLIVLLSCMEFKNDFIDDSQSIDLKVIDTIMFKVDNISPNAYVGHYSASDISYFYFADRHTNRIHKYLFPIDTIARMIDLPPNDRGLVGFYVHNPDSIFLQDNKLFRYYLIDKTGLIIDSVIINNSEYSPLPQVKIINPVYIDNGNFYFVGYLGGENPDEKIGDRSIITLFSSYGKKSENFGDYPDIYYKYNFAGLHFRRVFNTINTRKRAIILSFPASNNIFVFQIDDKMIYEYVSGSNHVKNIEPFSKNREWFGALAKQDYVEYYYQNPSYAEIYYDSYRDLYYRILELPNKEFDYHDMGSYFKEKIVIILDNKFRLVGSTRIVDNVDTKNGFITKEGIHFKLYDNDRMNIKFLLYSLNTQ